MVTNTPNASSRRRWFKRAFSGIAIALCAVHAGCGEPAGTSTAPGRRSVVATTGMIADVARHIGGERCQVTALMGEGVDPHLYKGSPGDVRLLEQAGLVLYNGLHLEGRLGEVLDGLAARKPTVPVAEAIPTDRLRTSPDFHGHPDPHVWFDVELWAITADRIRDAMVQFDPDDKAGYGARAEAYAAKLRTLHTWAKAQLATIPESRRVLVTSHDAFGYFGRAYGLRVMAIQGISTESEASINDINTLVDMLVAEKVPAVFIESSVSPKTIEALIEGAKSRGHAVKIGGELFSDAMGRDGTLEGTYIGMIRHNVQAVVTSLGGTYTDLPQDMLGKSGS